MRTARRGARPLGPCLVLVVAVGLELCARGQAVGSAPAAEPAWTAAEKAEFLRTAPVVASKSLSTGVTRPRRLTLTAGGVTHDAVFQPIDREVPMQRMANGRTELNFRDSYHFNIAAYGLAQLLGLGDMVPVTVEREWEGRKGSLSWWIDWKWDETGRQKANIFAPDPVDWGKQQSRMRVFSELVYDTDRNTGNLLIVEDCAASGTAAGGAGCRWQLWMVDFTRAFRLYGSLFHEENVQRCSRDLLAAMQALTQESATAATSPHLRPGEVQALLKRRDRIVARLDTLAKQRGENLVLF